MPLSNKLNKPVKKTYSYRSVNNNNNNMKKDFVLPLVAGIVLGALLMIFWQFNVRLNNTRTALAQIEQATMQNSTSINEIVNFINQATGQTGAQTGATGTETAQ